jgi:Protein of unknown function (DUF3365)
MILTPQGRAPFTTAILLACFCAAPASSQDALPTDPLVIEARGIVKQFAGELLGTLETAMEEGGPVAGVAVCQSAAPVIAADASKSARWSVGRTALKVRSPANAPDSYERKVLEDFAFAAKAGSDLAKLERFETVTENGKRTVRFMKAIPTAEPCLACHGSNLKPEVAKAIAELYSTDQATGFALGELRGAFTLKRELN